MTTIFGNTITDPKIAFSFEKDLLTLYAGLAPVSLAGKESIIGAAINTPYKYYFKIPSTEHQLMIGNINVSTIYYIEGFEEGQKYSQMTFSFPALDYFLANALFEKNNLSLTTEDKCYNWEYECKFRDHTLSFLFTTQRESVDSTNYKYTWRGLLRISCEQLFDTDFAYQVARYVQGLFSFVYNRADIVIGNVTLLGTKTYFRLKDPELKTNSVEEHSCLTQSTLKFTESFSDNARGFLNYEPNKHIGITLFETKFDILLRMLFEDKILFYPLTEADKKTYNLGRILYLNYMFEHYFKLVDSLYPSGKVVVVYNKKKESDKNDKKKVSELCLALRLMYVFDPNLITERKYKNAKIIRLNDFQWDGVCGILNNYYSNDRSYELIEHYTRWRHAEAHVNDLPLDDPLAFIESVRLVECMNYCVVLKIAGYSVEDIRSIIDRLLFDQNHGAPLPPQQ